MPASVGIESIEGMKKCEQKSCIRDVRSSICQVGREPLTCTPVDHVSSEANFSFVIKTILSTFPVCHLHFCLRVFYIEGLTLACNA